MKRIKNRMHDIGFKIHITSFPLYRIEYVHFDSLAHNEFLTSNGLEIKDQ